ncbi:MAG: outer membrane beta-barrel protein, partial [Gammaproteobacteria bacterium]
MTTYQQQPRHIRHRSPGSGHSLRGARLAVLSAAVAAAVGPGAMRTAVAQEAQSGLTAGQTAGERQRQGQEPLPPGAARDLPPKQEEQTPSPQKLRWGSFLVYPQVVLSALYDDNIYATRSNEKSDNIGILTPSIRLKSDWNRHKLDFNAGAELSRYVRYPDENTSDYWANADGRYDISGKSNVFGGVGYSREHEDRTSPDAVNGTEPTRYNVGSAYGGAYHNFGRAALRFGGTYEKLDFKDVPSLLGGVINNQDRNRTQTGVGARLSYNLQQGTDVYLQAATNRRRYDNTPDDNGFDRNSNGYSIAVGAKRALGETAQIDGYVGYLRQNYDDPQFTDVTTPDFQARLRWNPTSKTKVTAYLNRSIEETTLNNASGYVYTRGSVRAEHALRPDLSVHVLAFAGRADYNGLERTDDIYVSGVGAKYRLTRRWFLETDYRWINRDSTDLASNYHKNQIFLRLRGLMNPAEELQRPLAESAAFPLASAASYPGFYVGGQVGFGALNSDADGTRGGAGGSNTDIATMGSLGPSEGLFAGWGFTHDRWYLGLELEASDSQADWYHTKDKTGGRTFSVDKNRSYGASARLGYVLRNGALFYGRLGGVRTTFHTYYTQSGNPPGLTTVDGDFNQNGLRYGLGLEVPAGQHAFWRMDYTYTAYKDYNVDYGVDV